MVWRKQCVIIRISTFKGGQGALSDEVTIKLRPEGFRPGCSRWQERLVQRPWAGDELGVFKEPRRSRCAVVEARDEAGERDVGQITQGSVGRDGEARFHTDTTQSRWGVLSKRVTRFDCLFKKKKKSFSLPIRLAKNKVWKHGVGKAVGNRQTLTWLEEF